MITAKEAIEKTKEVQKQKRQSRIDRAIGTISDAIQESIEEGKFSTSGKMLYICGQEEFDTVLKYFQDLGYTISITSSSAGNIVVSYAWAVSWEEN